ncbi:XRE family transcriptional regulator [Nocardioidaceae bacterium]|nr:XRE family transcriptional regulator [Nocardioidaceae bacterium]
MREGHAGRSTGARVRAEREARGLTLSALAAAAGIGKGSLSELEAGRRNPTLDTLYALAGPLGLPLAALVSAVDVGDDALDAHRLHVVDGVDAVTEVYLIRVRPGAERRSPAHAGGAREQLVVLAGSGMLRVEGEDDTALSPGTHHAWRADRPHAYRCTSPVELVAVDVIVTPRSDDAVPTTS